VTETQFLIGLRVLCGLLCIRSSSTGYRWATVFQKQSETLRPDGLGGPCEHATPVFRLADTAPFVVAGTRAAIFCEKMFSVFSCSKENLAF
jgi:hypothetical protein